MIFMIQASKSWCWQFALEGNAGFVFYLVAYHCSMFYIVIKSRKKETTHNISLEFWLKVNASFQEMSAEWSAWASH